MDRLEYIVFEHGVFSQTAEDCHVSFDADGHVSGACSFEGTLMRDADSIPFALPEESSVGRASVDGLPVEVERISPGILSLALPEAGIRGSSHRLTIEYDGLFADGAMRDGHGGGWLELQAMTVWKPLLGFDPAVRTTSRGRLTLPASYAVAAGMGCGACRIDGDHRIVEWDTCGRSCADYSFVAGEGDWARGWHGDIELHALVMRGVPYGTEEVLQAAGKLLSLYEDLWGPYPFERLSIACPPASISGNCARAGLIIAGMVRETSPAVDRGFAILTHEIAHQWWGDSVYFSWAQLGLLEPLAAYGACRAIRRYCPEKYEADIPGLVALAKQSEQSGIPLIDCTWSTPYSWHLRESKGACVWLLLERLAGTELLDAALRQLATDFKGRWVGPDEIRAVFNTAGGEQGDRLFVDHVLGTVPIPSTPDAYLPGLSWP